MSQDQPPSTENSSEPSLEAAVETSQAATTEASVEAEQPSTAAESSNPEMVSQRSTPTRRSSSENDEILPQTLLRLVGEAFVAAQPPLKNQSIKALRSTIQLLEKTVERLEAEPVPKQARKRAPASSKASENALPSSSQALTNKRAPTFSTDALGEKYRAFWQQVWRSWRPLLRQIRDRLPAAINRKFSDQALTGAIGGILILFLWTASSLLPAKPQPTTIAKTPPAETVIPSPIPAPTPIPPLVKAPDVPKSVEISPAPSKPVISPPPLRLTPEQALIARIQNQVSAISNQYASGLVQSVQANFRGSRLIVNISDGWYDLSRSQQDNLAGEILRRTETLDFIKLEMVDASGKLLARSPVVGSEMIILKRSNALSEAV
ncbi:MAG: hypothetical protein KME42_17815 [Tildeniella nuda ZEHNDER 1965/U140]|jgi:hypothetical protein|nr:hypothetical protein [Tildeniella nuda ZEHNDER 1965/U140]